MLNILYTINCKNSIEKYEKIIIVKGIISFYKKRGDFKNISDF